MNATIEKKELLRLLSRCQGIASRKATLPMLANVLLSAADGRVGASATDTFLQITDSAPADVEKPGAFAAPARELAERIKAMPDGGVRLALDGTSLTIRGAGSRKFVLHAMPAKDFPELPKPTDNGPRASVPAAALRALIDAVHCSICPDETRPHINAALFDLGKTLRMTSTDGHRLCTAVVDHDADLTASMLVPLKAINEIRKLVDGHVDTVVLRPVKNRLFVELGDVTFGVQLVEAQFPPYQQVIPKKSLRSMTVDRKALVSALHAVKLSASDRTAGVKLTCLPESIRITSENPDKGNGSDEVHANTDGESAEFTIGVSAVYLAEVLESIGAERVRLSMQRELDPIAVEPIGDDDALEVGVIMPMKV